MRIGTHALLRIGLLANLLEWYEFSIYGYLAGILGVLFFKTTQPALALLFGFIPFTVSYLMRPLGSLFFGSIGDKISRKRALNLSLLMISIPTILIGLLPTYSQVGALAAVALIILRLVQGFGAGGERPLIGCYVFENAEPNKKGFLCSTVNVGAILGLLCGSMTFSLLSWCFDRVSILNYAWRIPFLLGIPITFYIFYIRQNIFDASDCYRPKQLSQEARAPITSIFAGSKAQLFQSILLVGFSASCFYILSLWIPTYLVYFLGYPQKIVALINVITLCSISIFHLVAGYLSDKLGYKRIMVFSILAMLVCIYPIFLAFEGKSYGVLLSAQLLYALSLSGLDALLIQYLGNLFPNSIRALGMSLGLTLGAVMGGLAPLVCTWLVHQTGLLTAPAFYVMFFALLALPVALRLKTPSDISI